MSKEKRIPKHPLLRRKFWMPLATAVGLFLTKYYGINLEAETIAGICVLVAVFVLGESHVDSKAVKKEES